MEGDPIRESIVVDADPAVVFEHFTNPNALVRWMGEYAVVDARPGGEFTVDIRGLPVRGTYLEVEPPHRIVVTWGHAGSEKLPPGSSRVEINITPDPDGTKVEIVHRGLPGTEREGFEIGWRHYAARLAIVAAGGDAGPDSGM